MKKKLLFFTGKRGGINHFIPLIHRLAKDKRFDLNIIFSDMHMSKIFGKTYKNYNQLKIKKHFSHSLSASYSGSKYDRAFSLSLGMSNNINLLKKIKPDFLFVLGDRSELFSILTPAIVLNIPVGHFYGGDITQGCTDEPTRHAISMLSNIHFVSNERSKKNLQNFGISKANIHNVGLLSLNSFDFKKSTKKDTFKKFNLDKNKKSLILIFHPETWNLGSTKKQIKTILSAISEFDCNKTIIYPCSDPGFKIIIDEIKKFKIKDKFSKIYKDIKSNDFYELMFHSDVLVGNSSTGILESHYCKIPSINIGSRQLNRYQTKNVFNINFNKEKIAECIKDIFKKKIKFYEKDSFYFKKKGVEKTYNIIKNIDFKNSDIFKQKLKLI